MLASEMRSMKFADIYIAVRTAHENSPTGHAGHGTDHDLAVAMMGFVLAEEAGLSRQQAEMAYVAGLIHSADTVIGEDKNLNYAVEGQLDMYLNRLPAGCFTPAEISEIKTAALRHTEFKDKNLESRSLTQKLLMDADKLINLNLLLVIRAGQYRPNVPAIELEFVGIRNPASTYKNPTSIVEDLHGSLEWVEPGWFHFPEAQKRAEGMADDLRWYIKKSGELFEELGLAGIRL